MAEKPNLYPFTTTIRSLINEEITAVGGDITLPDAAVIVGVAEKGPKYTPVDLATLNKPIEEVFGQAIGGERSLVRAFTQLRDLLPDTTNIRLMRVGKTSRPSISVYEAEEGVGVFAPNPDPNNGAKHVSLKVIGPDDTVAGRVQITITGNGIDPATGLTDPAFPSEITVSNATTGAQILRRTLDMSGATPGALKSVGEIVDAMTSHPEGYFNQDIAIANGTPDNFLGYAFTELISDEKSITVVASGDNVRLIYDAPAELSGGGADKIAAIAEVYSNKEVTEQIDALGQVDLDYIPAKEAGGGPTISQFKLIVRDDILENASIADSGKDSTILKAASIDGNWVKSTAISDRVIRLRPAGAGSYVTLVLGTDYTVDGVVAGKINFKSTSAYFNGSNGRMPFLNPGDLIVADYKYEAAFTEAKLRSNLERGNAYSYFVIGGQIIFGAAPSRDMQITYTSRISYALGSEVILGAIVKGQAGYEAIPDDSIVFFPGALDTLEAGDVVNVAFNKFPELPAPTGYIFSDLTTQKEGMTNGTDGTTQDIRSYKKEVENALKLTESYPARWIIVADAYLDDSIQDYNPDTGLLEQRNAGWQNIIEDACAYKSEYTGECQWYLPIRQPQSGDPISAKNWLQRATVVSASDKLRAANIMQTVADYHGVIVAGSCTLDGTISTAINPAYVLLAMKIIDKNNATQSESFINRPVPFGVRPVEGFQLVSMQDKNDIARTRLAGFGYYQGAYVLLDDPTAARPGSNLDRQNTVDNVFDALRDIREAAAPFIGKRITDANMQVMKNNIQKALEGYINEPKKFITFQIEVKVLPGERLKGTARIIFKVVDAVTLRNIIIETSVEKG